MSQIDPTVPLGSEEKKFCFSRIREHRVWLRDAVLAYLGSHQGTGLDPATFNGKLKIPNILPPVPRVGNLFASAAGILLIVQHGPVIALAGDLERGTKCVFHQASAPALWTRDVASQTNSGLRYVTGVPGFGGGLNFDSILSHSITTTTLLPYAGGSDRSYVIGAADHPVLKYVDVITASRQ